MGDKGHLTLAAMSSAFSIGNINPGSVRTEYMLSIMAAVEYQRAIDPPLSFGQYLSAISNPYLDDARNHVCALYLAKTDSDRLLFVDSDIGFMPHQAWDLVELANELDEPLIGGTYFNAYHPEGIRPVAYHEDDSHVLNLITREEIANHDGPYPVDAFGTGFMLIHRDLLLQMAENFAAPTPYFAEIVYNGVHHGEDQSFCLRARSLGVQPYIVPSIIVDHYKTTRIH